jgi:hypothetical protein
MHHKLCSGAMRVRGSHDDGSRYYRMQLQTNVHAGYCDYSYHVM